MSRKSWQEELASLVEETGIGYTVDVDGEMVPVKSVEGGKRKRRVSRNKWKGLSRLGGELIVELGKGCVYIFRQNCVTDDSYVVRKLSNSCAKVSRKLRFLNEFLPEDKDPALAWPVVLFKFVLTWSG